MKKEDLLKLIEDDDFGLLNIKPKQPVALTENERLVASFHDINQFISEHGREPIPGNDINEHKLYARLKGIRENKDKVRALLDLDEHGLLQKNVREVKSINDIFEDDNLGILDDNVGGIFTLKHISKETIMPDYVARRKPCKDFSSYENLFKECHADLVSGKKILQPFANEQQIKEGSFFILNGIMVYVEIVGEKQKINRKVNARLRCIFENGTESDMLLRSLAVALYKNGRRIFKTDGSTMENLEQITDEDINTGYIYILRSLSNKPEISSIKNLYKIGFSKQPIEERIKNSNEDPTFLMGKVAIVSVYRCYNLKPQKMEQLLHTFFGKSCLDVDVYDLKGKRHIPREWFIAPLDVIENTVTLLINGEIVHYVYDEEKQEIIAK